MKEGVFNLMLSFGQLTKFHNVKVWRDFVKCELAQHCLGYININIDINSAWYNNDP